MNDLPLEYYVNLIDTALDNNNSMLAEILDGPSYRKINDLVSLLGTAHGDMLWIRDQIMAEMEIKKNKKFWQFWK